MADYCITRQHAGSQKQATDQGPIQYETFMNLRGYVHITENKLLTSHSISEVWPAGRSRGWYGSGGRGWRLSLPTRRPGPGHDVQPVPRLVEHGGEISSNV